MVTLAFGTLDNVRAVLGFTEETLPDFYLTPISPTTMSRYNDRIDLMAQRIYGTTHSVALRTLIWANDFIMSDWLRVFPEGVVINTPPITAVLYTREQSEI